MGQREIISPWPPLLPIEFFLAYLLNHLDMYDEHTHHHQRGKKGNNLKTRDKLKKMSHIGFIKQNAKKFESSKSCGIYIISTQLLLRAKLNY